MKNTVTEEGAPRRKRAAIEPLDISTLGELQEGQDLDFKREIDLGKPDAKGRFLDDVTAFLNRGGGRIIVGVIEKGGRFERFWPMKGDADRLVLRLQTMIQNSISPVPLDVQVVPIHLDEESYVLDIQIPRHSGGPFMNRVNGSYLIRSGARNLPIDPGMLRSRFVDEPTWIRRLEELTDIQDKDLAESGRVAAGRSLRIGILPAEHFDHHRDPFTQGDQIRYPGPIFRKKSNPWFKAVEDGSEIFSSDLRARGIERLFVRDDWFVHATIAFALKQTQGEGRLAFREFNENLRAYLSALAGFFEAQGIVGPFAVTIALRGLEKDEHFGAWFPRTSVVCILRPRLLQGLDDPQFVEDFLLKVRQASLDG